MSVSLRILSVVASVLLLGSWAMPVSAQATRAPEVMAAYEEGMKLLNDKQYDAAIAEFNKATTADQTFAEAYIARGDALRGLEDYASALQSYTQAENLTQKSPQLYLGRGIAYREMGTIDMAINDFNNALDLDRNNAQAAADLGDLLVNRTQDPTNALRVLKKAVELDAENAKSFRNLGLAHAQLRQFEEAEKALAKSVELKNDDFETYSMQANIFLFQDKTEKMPQAIEALTKAIEFYPSREKPEATDPKSYVQGYLLRSDAYLKLATDPKTPKEESEDYYKKLIADTDAVLEENPDQYPISGQALYRKGVAERAQGLYGEAIKALTDAIQQLPPGESGSYAPEAYLKRGICWHMQGENRLARGDFQQAAALDFADPLPHMWTGFTFAEEKDFRGAIDAYGEAISRNPNFSLPYINRGLAYVQLGEYNRAADNFNEAIRVEPSNADNFIMRGDAYMKLDEFEKAYNSYHLATLNDDKNAQAFEKAARALRELGRSAAAETYEERAQELKSVKS